MIRSLRTLLPLVLAGIAATPGSARGADSKGVIHKVGDRQETYEELAEHYYGRRALALHLRLFNRRAEPLARGTTILIPTYSMIPLRKGQSLDQFAEEYLNDASRAEYLAELHGLSGRLRASPKPGTKLRAVPSLRHLVRPGESLRSIARVYYRDANAARIRLLERYNNLSGDVRPGMTVRIPLDEPEFNQAVVAARAKVPFTRAPVLAENDPPASKAAREPQPRRRFRPKREAGGKAASEPPEGDAEPAAAPIRVEERLEELDRLCGEGEWSACETTARRTLEEAPSAPEASQVELLRIRAVALIALGRVEESRVAFKRLLALDPEYDLDLYRTSPKILDVFQAVAER